MVGKGSRSRVSDLQKYRERYEKAFGHQGPRSDISPGASVLRDLVRNSDMPVKKTRRKT